MAGSSKRTQQHKSGLSLPAFVALGVGFLVVGWFVGGFVFGPGTAVKSNVAEPHKSALRPSTDALRKVYDDKIAAMDAKWSKALNSVQADVKTLSEELNDAIKAVREATATVKARRRRVASVAQSDAQPDAQPDDETSSSTARTTSSPKTVDSSLPPSMDEELEPGANVDWSQLAVDPDVAVRRFSITAMGQQCDSSSALSIGFEDCNFAAVSMNRCPSNGLTRNSPGDYSSSQFPAGCFIWAKPVHKPTYWNNNAGGPKTFSEAQKICRERMPIGVVVDATTEQWTDPQTQLDRLIDTLAGSVKDRPFSLHILVVGPSGIRVNSPSEPHVFAELDTSTSADRLSQRVWQDGTRYLLLVDGPIEFHAASGDWTMSAVRDLASFTPSLIGAVAPACDGSDSASAHAVMLHKSHADTFSSKLFASEAESSAAAVFAAYAPSRSRVVKSWKVKCPGAKSGATTSAAAGRAAVRARISSLAAPIELNMQAKQRSLWDPSSPAAPVDPKRVAILSPLTTRCLNIKDVQELSLAKILIPSLKRTIEPSKYEYVLYVAIDDDDDMRYHLHELEKLGSDALQVRPVLVPNSGTFVKAVNYVARRVYSEGATYIVRVNDDSEFLTPGWTSRAISVLQGYSPPNVGVVGPVCKQGNTAILTHDMVHRSHMEIFKDEYYPNEFQNFYIDDWITKVYDKSRTTRLDSWEVKHHVDNHGTRYNPHTDSVGRLDEIPGRDRPRIEAYVASHR